MRVLLAPFDIAGQMRMTALELDKRGHYARFFDGDTNYLGYEHEEGQQFALKDLPSLADYDVFDIFFGAFKPIGKKKDFPKNLKFVHHFCGSDVRQLDIAKEHNRFAVIKEIYTSKGIRKRLKEDLSVITDHCTIMDEELRPHVEPFFKYVHIVPRMVDLDKFNPIYNGHKKLTVVHASTHGEVKGTPDIIRAVKNLKNSRDFDFWLVAGMQHRKAMELYQKADIVVCQLNLDSYGIFAIEAMALGKVVITRLSDKMRATYPENPPLISADPTDIREVLADVLKLSPEKRIEIGRKGREYVERYHSPDVVMPKLINVYEQLKSLYESYTPPDMRFRDKEATVAHYDTIYSTDAYVGAERYISLYKAVEVELRKMGSPKILEIGCGLGDFGNKLVGIFDNYCGIDFSSVAIEQAKGRFPKIAEKFSLFDIYDLDKFTGEYDTIVGCEVFEHIDDLKFVKKVKPGTRFVLSLPHYGATLHLRMYTSPKQIRERFRGLIEFSSITGHYILGGSHRIWIATGTKI